MFLRPMHLLLVLCFPGFCQQARKRYSAFGFNYRGQLVLAIIVFLYEDEAEAADEAEPRLQTLLHALLLDPAAAVCGLVAEALGNVFQSPDEADATDLGNQGGR